MTYSDFTLSKIQTDFAIQLIDVDSIFGELEPIEPSHLLTETLQENIPLALAINTEKARSELIVMNILVELRKIFHHKISLFSGIEFNIEKNKGLNGFCDFIISQSPQQLLLSSPVITLVEAKNDNIKIGLGQCIAEMIAADLFNKKMNNAIDTIYGVVTTGTNWKFLKLHKHSAYIESQEDYIQSVDKILSKLSAMLK